MTWMNTKTTTATTTRLFNSIMLASQASHPISRKTKEFKLNCKHFCLLKCNNAMFFKTILPVALSLLLAISLPTITAQQQQSATATATTSSTSTSTPTSGPDNNQPYGLSQSFFNLQMQRPEMMNQQQPGFNQQANSAAAAVSGGPLSAGAASSLVSSGLLPATNVGSGGIGAGGGEGATTMTTTGPQSAAAMAIASSNVNQANQPSLARIQWQQAWQENQRREAANVLAKLDLIETKPSQTLDQCNEWFNLNLRYVQLTGSNVQKRQGELRKEAECDSLDRFFSEARAKLDNFRQLLTTEGQQLEYVSTLINDYLDLKYAANANVEFAKELDAAKLAEPQLTNGSNDVEQFMRFISGAMNLNPVQASNDQMVAQSSVNMFNNQQSSVNDNNDEDELRELDTTLKQLIDREGQLSEEEFNQMAELGQMLENILDDKNVDVASGRFRYLTGTLDAVHTVMVHKAMGRGSPLGHSNQRPGSNLNMAVNNVPSSMEPEINMNMNNVMNNMNSNNNFNINDNQQAISDSGTTNSQTIMMPNGKPMILLDQQSQHAQSQEQVHQQQHQNQENQQSLADQQRAQEMIREQENEIKNMIENQENNIPKMPEMNQMMTGGQEQQQASASAQAQVQADQQQQVMAQAQAQQQQAMAQAQIQQQQAQPQAQIQQQQAMANAQAQAQHELESPTSKMFSKAGEKLGDTLSEIGAKVRRMSQRRSRFGQHQFTPATGGSASASASASSSNNFSGNQAAAATATAAFEGAKPFGRRF